MADPVVSVRVVPKDGVADIAALEAKLEAETGITSYVDPSKDVRSNNVVCVLVTATAATVEDAIGAIEDAVENVSADIPCEILPGDPFRVEHDPIVAARAGDEVADAAIAGGTPPVLDGEDAEDYEPTTLRFDVEVTEGAKVASITVTPTDSGSDLEAKAGDGDITLVYPVGHFPEAYVRATRRFAFDIVVDAKEIGAGTDFELEVEVEDTMGRSSITSVVFDIDDGQA